MLETFRRLQLEVIVVNQSSPEITRNRLHCVKVIVPGMLPMTFGHHLIRITGLRRLLEVPYRMGYVQQPLSYEQLNPHPHPFF
jgi:ribosomal protein S12 methylthiotransferase accessory factor